MWPHGQIWVFYTKPVNNWGRKFFKIIFGRGFYKYAVKYPMYNTLAGAPNALTLMYDGCQLADLFTLRNTSELTT